MDLGLRQSDVANRIGVGTSTVNYWENNHFNPDVQYVPKIVALLGYHPFGPPPASFPLQLKATRIAAGLTRGQLATRLGVHPGTVAKWERGEARPVKALRERLDAFVWVVVDELARARNGERRTVPPASSKYGPTRP
jgi:transcriptional regulator with XRE-family HTH domain